MGIRVVAPAEWRAWRELRLRALAESPDSFGETLEGARGRDEAGWSAATAVDPARVVLIAEEGSEWLGTVVARVAPDEPRRAHLYAMWVAPEVRGRGVGRALVGAAMRWARLAGAATLVLRVTAERAPAALGLYRSLGFADTGAVEALRPGSPIQTQVLQAQLGPLVMGVVNATPDSFSDGGRYLDPEAAIAHGLALLRAGADLLDVGGEATNPRAVPVDAAEELRRIEPVIHALVAAGATVSVDTTKASVARAAAAAGAAIINDVSGGLFDPEMSSMLAGFGGTYIAGHLRGRDLTEVFAVEGTLRASIGWREVAAELAERIAALPASLRGRIWVDPGVGFGKGADPEVNLALLRHAGDLGRAVGCPVVVGPSRKRFLRRLVATASAEVAADAMAAVTLEQLDAASVSASLGAWRAGANVVRVHNVALLRAALAVYTRI